MAWIVASGCHFEEEVDIKLGRHISSILLMISRFL
jgi:hypothetical protein